MQAWWCATLSRKKIQAHRCFRVSLLYMKTYFVKHVRTDAWVIWTKKLHSQNLLTGKHRWWRPFLCSCRHVGLRFSKIDFITDAFPWKLGSFTEHQFYRTMLASASHFLWHFRCITYFISDKSVQSWHGDIILVLCQY